MGIDRDFIERALADLRRWVGFLRGLGALDPSRLETDLKEQLALLHALQLATQIVLDTGAHLLADLATGSIAEYAEIGPRLARAGVLDAGLGERLAEMARFRNLLVHGYAHVRMDLVVENVTRGLRDFDDFAAAVLAHLDRMES